MKRYNKIILKSVLKVFVITLFIMTLYEESKQILIPNISIFLSHIITIIFCTTAASLVTFFLIKKRSKSLIEVLKQNELRKKAEDRMRIFFETLPLGVYRTTPDGEILFSNQAMVSMLGFSSFEELQKRNIENDGYETPEMRNKFKEIIERDGEIKAFEEIFLKKDGSQIIVNEYAKVIKDANGEIICYEGIIEDITDRKKTEEELKKSEERMRLFIESVPIGVYRTTPKGKILFANPAVVKMLGYSSQEELNAMNVITHGIASPDDRSKFHEIIEKEGEISGYEEILIRKDGEQIIVNEYASAVKDEDGTVKYYSGIMEDITEWKHAETAMKISEERFRIIFDQAPLGIALIDSISAQFIEVNTKFSEIVGRTKDEMTQIDWVSITHPDDIKEDSENMALLNAGKINGFTMNKRYFKKDGSLVWINMTIAPIDVEEKSSPRHLCMIEDITERKHFLEELVRLRKAVESSGEVIFITDKEGIINYVNPEFNHLYGWSQDEIIGKLTPRILKSGVMDDEHYKAFWESISKKIVVSGEFLNRTKDGRIINIEGSVNPIIAEDGTIEGYLAIQKDITRRRKSEEEIRRLSNVVEQSSTSIMITDIKGDIIYVNPWFVQLTGYDLEEVIGKNPKMLKSGKNNPEMYVQMWETITSGKVWKGEFCNKKKNGDFYWELVTISPVIDSSGKIISYVAIKDDITHRKEIDEALLASEKRLKELNVTKDKFFSIIAHDLKSSLGGFKNMLEIMDENYDDFGENEKKEVIFELNNSSRNVYNLLENLLNWANSQSGRIKFTPEMNDINEIISKCTSLLSGYAQSKKISLVTDLKDIGKILIDSNMIYTVVRNLISNAIKFTREDGVIKIFSYKTKDFIVVSVNDNGVGMEKEIMDMLFRLDLQQSSIGTANEKGTGLGLILCKEFVEKHDGTMHVDSEPGKGSTFSFTIPVRYSD